MVNKNNKHKVPIEQNDKNIGINKKFEVHRTFIKLVEDFTGNILLNNYFSKIAVEEFSDKMTKETRKYQLMITNIR